MEWIHFLMDSRSVMSVFKRAPSLKGVRINELTLREDGPCMSLRIDLNEFPLTPPEKWKTQGANRVQLTLCFIDVSKLAIQGWGLDNVGDVALEKVNDEADLQLSIEGSGIYIACCFKFLQMERISAYHDSSVGS
ncbi:MAG TPA: Imm50 family immunity protein [Pirellulaceae bacterium]|nr:Imm50 family immunity protein [Pirellulaceae bacterium]